ncbi:GspH/FimT family pseudopilin [Halochromatium sp.]
MSITRAGFTLLELLVIVSIMSILAVVAVPAFIDLHDRYRLKGVVDTLYADLQFARSEAVRRNDDVFVGFAAGANWCYGLDSLSDCACDSAGDCDIKTVSAAAYPSVTLSSITFSGDTTSFKPRLGTVSAGGTLVLESAEGKQARVVVSPLGRVRRCSPSGSANIAYYPSC